MGLPLTLQRPRAEQSLDRCAIRANISSNNIELNPADNVVMETRYKAYVSNAGEYKIYLPFIKR